MSNRLTAAIRPSTLLLLTLASLTGCEAVEWGGAEVSVEPPPAPEDTAEAPSDAEAPLPPLPGGPLLFYVRLGDGGEVLLTPVARVAGQEIGTLELPADVPEEWWARFDSTFLAPGRELTLHAAGRRIGSAVIDSTRAGRPGCPAVAVATALVPPGAHLPAEAFARPADTAGGPVLTLRSVEPSRRMRVFAPILTERLLEEAGEGRHYLARRATLQAVPVPGDNSPGLAATFLINDTLAARPPSGSAVSLAYLATFDPATGYQPAWRLVRKYGADGEKQAFVYVSSLRLAGEGGESTYVLRRYDARSVRLAAGRVRDDGSLGITWVEGDRCPVARAMP